jgi:hypothetical protein
MALKTARHMDDDDNRRGMLTPYAPNGAGDQPHFVRPLAPTHTPQQVCFN